MLPSLTRLCTNVRHRVSLFRHEQNPGNCRHLASVRFTVDKQPLPHVTSHAFSVPRLGKTLIWLDCKCDAEQQGNALQLAAPLPHATAVLGRRPSSASLQRCMGRRQRARQGQLAGAEPHALSASMQLMSGSGSSTHDGEHFPTYQQHRNLRMGNDATATVSV